MPKQLGLLLEFFYKQTRRISGLASERGLWGDSAGLGQRFSLSLHISYHSLPSPNVIWSTSLTALCTEASCSARVTRLRDV